MSIVTLDVFKSYMRELTPDLDVVFQLALDAAEAEAGAFVCFRLDETYTAETIPSDMAMACMLLARAHAEDGDAERYRGIAQQLLRPYRLDAGVRSA